MYSLMSGSVQEAVPDVQECLGGPTGCLGVVGRPSQMSRSCREVLRMSRRCPGVVERHS